MRAFKELFPLPGEKEIRIPRLPKQVADAPADAYILHEYYCDAEQCDCRYVLIRVVGENTGHHLCTLCIDFDQNPPVDGSRRKGADRHPDDANDGLQLFFRSFLSEPERIALLQRHYMMVKERIENRPYAGPVWDNPHPQIIVEPSAAIDPRHLKPEDLQLARTLVEEVIDLWERSGAPPQSRYDIEPVKPAIQQDPLLAFPLLKLLITAYAPNGRLPQITPRYEACLTLLEEALNEIRYGTERERDWAVAAAREIQTVMAEEAFRIEVDIRIQSDLVQALYQAHLDVQPVIKDKSEELAEYYMQFSGKGGSPDVSRLFRTLAHEFEGYPHALYERIVAEMAVMPRDTQLALMAHMLTTDIPLFQELLPFHYLHPNPEIHARVPEMAEELVQPDAVSPATLRRLIGLRNWLPAPQRPGLDHLIKSLRKARIECAAMPAPAGRIDQVLATPIDGSGAQGVMVLVRGESDHIVSVLVKQDFGIRDIWIEQALGQAESQHIISDFRANGIATPVSEAYLHPILRHSIWTGLQQQRVPPPLLLSAAEHIGCPYWQPAPFDFDGAVSRLSAEGRRQLYPKNIRRVMDESREWAIEKPFAISWFEDDRRVEEIIEAIGQRYPDPDEFLGAAMDRVLDDILDEKRQTWFERLVWMTLWSRHAHGRRPVAWQKLLIAARQLQQADLPHEVPLLLGVAEQTVVSAMQRRHRMLFPDSPFK